MKIFSNNKIYAATSKSHQNYSDVKYKMGDVILFGSETAGLPNYVFDTIPFS